jgi:isocitrate dehydrogenase
MSFSITVAKGDGIGPYIMDATLKILDVAKCGLKYDEIEVGENVYKAGYTTGISDSSWDIIYKNPVFLKAPITTPQGGGYKSLNVTIRKKLALYANIRPVKALAPFVSCHFPDMNLVTVRENSEDLYIGSEYRQTENTFQALKVVTKQGVENIVRYAFEYAKSAGRKKVTCMTKDNIMKVTDGSFHKIFDSIAKEYPEIENEHYIIDIGSARIGARPEIFDVIVTLNLYGDIISDIAAEVSGSVGLSGSSNIGRKYGMFEAIHGSAPAMADKSLANPTGLLNGAIMMLSHLGLGSKANLVENALLKTIEDGIVTKDIFNEHSKKKVNCDEFADAIIANLGQKPKKLAEANYKDFKFEWTDKSPLINDFSESKIEGIDSENKKIEGIDIFIDKKSLSSDFGDLLSKIDIKKINDSFELSLIAFNGLKVYPNNNDPVMADNWCCRFLGKNLTNLDLCNLILLLTENSFDIIKTEGLFSFDGKNNFTTVQGE